MMKRIFLIAAAQVAAATAAGARLPDQQSDSLDVTPLRGVEVTPMRATPHTPVAFTNIDKEQIRKTNYGQDIPLLLSITPSAVATSDAGAGVGYTSLRVRGTDGTRINVTANGIPLNDPESHTLYWVDLPDLASSVNDIQVQRGVGTSTNGAGAFGASVNIQTAPPSTLPAASLDASYGSFETYKTTLRLATGLLGSHWTFDLALSRIGTDGYIDRASADLKSHHFQAAYHTRGTSVKFVTFAGSERTYHAWNYATREEMARYGRTYNSCGYMYTDTEGKAHYYDDQIDNYDQTNYQLLLSHSFGQRWHLSAALHYTRGDGYYQEYKTNRKLFEYGLASSADTQSESDLVRKKATGSDFWGGVFTLSYQGERVHATLGGALNRYTSNHYGLANPAHALDAWIPVWNAEPYYRNRSAKNDGNFYLRSDVRLTPALHAYADVQYRQISYRLKGTNDKYDYTTMAGMQPLDFHERYHFLNPKVGLSWQPHSRHRVYGSIGVAHKEPTRDNYTDAHLNRPPQAERLIDYEAGYAYTSPIFSAGANLYFMHYHDQLVLTGELNEIGQPLADNVPSSYRAGIELTAGLAIPCGIRWDINATLSRNRIKDFAETLYENEDPASAPWVIRHGSTPIAFSPDLTLNSRLTYARRGWQATLLTQYVSRQYMSNARQEDCALPAYCVSNLLLSHTFATRRHTHRPTHRTETPTGAWAGPARPMVTVGCGIYNIFGETYESNGYAGSGYTTAPDGTRTRYNYAGFAAQAPTHFMTRVSLQF